MSRMETDAYVNIIYNYRFSGTPALALCDLMCGLNVPYNVEPKKTATKWKESHLRRKKNVKRRKK